MSAIFNGTSSVIYIASSLVGATPTYPILFHCLVKCDDLTTDNFVVSVWSDTVIANSDWLRLGMRGNVAGDPVQCQAAVNSSGALAFQNSRYTTGVWHRVMGYYVGVAERYAWIDGKISSISTGSKPVLGMAYTVLGASWFDSAFSQFAKCRIAKAAIWNGGTAATYTGTIIPALESGTSPERVSAGDATLVMYKELLDQVNGPDDVGGTFTAVDISYDAGDHGRQILNYSFKGPDTTDHDGYATDGTNHYMSDQSPIAIRKRNNDATWTVSTENTTDILTGTQDELGDLHYFTYQGTGYLIAPVSKFTSCASNGEATITTFGTGAGLPRLGSLTLPGATGSISSVVRVGADGELGTLYFCDFCNGRTISRYAINALDSSNGITSVSKLPSITLTQDIGYPQGIAYKNGYLYISTTATDTGGAPQRVWRANLGGYVEKIIESGLPFTAEGLDASQSTLRWHIDSSEGGDEEHTYFTTYPMESIAAPTPNSPMFHNPLCLPGI